MVFRDISREKELEQAKNDFLSLTSHQLRTPLSITKWVIEAFGHDVTLNSKQKDRLNDLFVSNERLINLVNKLLNVTRLESGKLVINKEKVDLKKLIVELCLSLNKFAQNKNKIIKLNIPTVIENINCDPILIHEALENLIVNAINYSPDDTKEVIVSIVDSENEYLVSVHNDGVMEDALIEKIGKYEKFYRGDKATKSLPAGSGLGLYVTKKVIEASGGTFGFESNKKI